MGNLIFHFVLIHDIAVSADVYHLYSKQIIIISTNAYGTFIRITEI